MGTLAEIWTARKQILEGVKNLAIKNEFVETVVAYREPICKTCDYYDGKCATPGTGPCCGACGCSLAIKMRALSSPCGMTKLGKTPKWLPVLTQQQEDELDVAELDELNNDEAL